jgi:hypothetical protein
MSSSLALLAADTAFSEMRTCVTGRRHKSMNLDFIADLNQEDDQGLNWARLSDATSPQEVKPGAILAAGTERFWSWVRVEAVDEDGQIHFRQIISAEARNGQLPAAG